MKKLKLKNEIKEMSLEETFIQFEAFLHKMVNKWSAVYDCEDLFQVASMGLIKAYNTYKIDRNILFISYLGSVVNNCILMQLRKEKKHLDCLSLQMIIVPDESDGIKLEDMIKDETDYEEISINNVLKPQLKELLNDKLTEKEKNIIMGTYFENKTQMELADIYNTGQPNVSRIIKRSIKKLRKSLEDTTCRTMSNGFI